MVALCYSLEFFALTSTLVLGKKSFQKVGGDLIWQHSLFPLFLAGPSVARQTRHDNQPLCLTAGRWHTSSEFAFPPGPLLQNSLLTECVRVCVCVCACVCAYLSDGLGHPVAAAGVCEAYSCVQADLVAHGHVNWLGALIRATQRLHRESLFNIHLPSWLWSPYTLCWVWLLTGCVFFEGSSRETTPRRKPICFYYCACVLCRTFPSTLPEAAVSGKLSPPFCRAAICGGKGTKIKVREGCTANCSKLRQTINPLERIHKLYL